MKSVNAFKSFSSFFIILHFVVGVEDTEDRKKLFFLIQRLQTVRSMLFSWVPLTFRRYYNTNKIVAVTTNQKPSLTKKLS